MSRLLKYRVNSGYQGTQTAYFATFADALKYGADIKAKQPATMGHVLRCANENREDMSGDKGYRSGLDDDEQERWDEQVGAE